MTGGDLEAMESRVGVGGVSDAPQYKTMMSTVGAGAGQQRYGQSRLRGGAESLNNLWYQYGLAANNGQMGQNTFASRKGVAAGGAGGRPGQLREPAAAAARGDGGESDTDEDTEDDLLDEEILEMEYRKNDPALSV